MSHVVRIRRKAGDLVQGCDVYIGGEVKRGGWDLPCSEWQNPYKFCSRDKYDSLIRYENYLRRDRPDLMARLHELEGKVLGCWCKPNLCHGDVLVKLLGECGGHTSDTATNGDTQTGDTDHTQANDCIDNIGGPDFRNLITIR